MSTIQANLIEPSSGTTLTLGASGDTVTLPSGVSMSGFNSVGIDDNAVANAITIDSSGAVTKPLTPAFFAKNTSTRMNVTGNAVLYTVIFDTELFDQNADYNTSTGQFTAPVSGRYLLCAQVSTDGQSTTNTDATFQLNTSNQSTDTYYNPGNMEGPAATGQCSISASGIFDMDANDTANVKVRVNQGTQVINVMVNTFFSGVLVA